MPTFTLSCDDCQQAAVAITTILAISPCTPAERGAYIRIRNLMNGAGAVGAFSPAVALGVLDDLANNSAGMSLMLRQPQRSQESTDHAIRLQSGGMLDGHRDQYGVQSANLTQDGVALRAFLHGWNIPIPPFNVPALCAVTV